MTESKKTFDRLQERVEAMRKQIESDLLSLSKDMDQARDLVEDLATAESDWDKKIRQLEERAEGQGELIETLTQEAAEARALRGDLRDRELEIERLKSELDSKQELIRALRGQLDEVDQLKATAKQRDKKIFEQQHELDRKQKEIDRVNREIVSLRAELEEQVERTADVTAVDSAELVAVKAELDARKTMIKSLRADAERAESLEVQLEAKREAIKALEDSIDQHVETIAELKRSLDAWRKKYQAARGELIDDQDETLSEPAFSDTELDELRKLEEGEAAPERTVAIDMRDALREARRDKARAKT